jgi:hypothetical protein
MGVIASVSGQDRVSPTDSSPGLIEFPADATADLRLVEPLPDRWLDLPSIDQLEPDQQNSESDQTLPIRLPKIADVRSIAEPPPFAGLSSSADSSSHGVTNASGWPLDPSQNPVQPIPSVIEDHSHVNRIVRYDVPLADLQSHQTFGARGIEGELIEIPVTDQEAGSWSLRRFGGRVRSFVGLGGTKAYPQTTRVIRYEVPADEIELHTTLVELDGEILDPGMLRLPEVRFFQPKARVFMDLKKDNDDQFDLFSNGAILASLDIVELYFPMPLISDRFARAIGKSSRLSKVGWRVGGTVGLGISTAINNGGSDNGSAPISTISSGIRYEFPLGRPTRELIETGDPRFDQRTRVGIESGVQGGMSTDETLEDSTDAGFYFGILVNTPWTYYGG